MDSLPLSPSAPETPDETIRRLTAELREARDQQAATTGKVSLTDGERRADARSHPPPRWGRAGVGVMMPRTDQW
jgi:hypothetical protein